MGNARTALVAWWSVRQAGGTFIVRIEDLDPPRVVEGSARQGLEDLEWLGLDWDEGPGARQMTPPPDTGVDSGARQLTPGSGDGPFGPYWQSLRGPLYEAALDHLAVAGRLFPCPLSRKDLRELASAPHDGDEGGSPYPRRLRPEAFRRGTLEQGWLETLRRQWAVGEDPEMSVRFAVDEAPVGFVDRVLGQQQQRVDSAVGDFVLRRRDGLWAYQLAVVVDDLSMAIDDVVRGADLLGSTARQIQLLDALRGLRLSAPSQSPGAKTPMGVASGEYSSSSPAGDPPPSPWKPAYAHVPLVTNADGEKLSKRDQGLTLGSLREAGVDPRDLVGYLAWSLGLLPEPTRLHPGEVLPYFEYQRLQREDFRLPVDLVASLRQMMPG